jgi:hypothetical protein
MSTNGKGSRQRLGKPGAYARGWERVFGKRVIEEKPLCCGSTGCTNPADEEHECPYQSEINDNHSFTCTCCADCRHECAMDI